jgi:hypothetical protein
VKLWSLIGIKRASGAPGYNYLIWIDIQSYKGHSAMYLLCLCLTSVFHRHYLSNIKFVSHWTGLKPQLGSVDCCCIFAYTVVTPAFLQFRSDGPNHRKTLTRQPSKTLVCCLFNLRCPSPLPFSPFSAPFPPPNPLNPRG